MARAEDDEEEDLIDEVGRNDIALNPTDAADPQAIVDAKIPADIREKYEVYSYRSAAVILSDSRPEEFGDLLDALRKFSITKSMIRTAGGNESEIPKILSPMLRPKGWHETVIRGDLKVSLLWKEFKGQTKAGKAQFKPMSREILRERYLDGHKIDFVKGKTAFDLEWNSKDQTFDRDLYAFSAFAQTGVIDVGVLVTRGASLTPVLRALGPALKKDGSVELKSGGVERQTHEKYGASTTWMGKLLYRLNAGRNGACPVLALGITPKCISDL